MHLRQTLVHRFATSITGKSIANSAPGRLGWEAQFFVDREFRLSRRFETRALAVQWAEQERATWSR